MTNRNPTPHAQSPIPGGRRASSFGFLCSAVLFAASGGCLVAACGGGDATPSTVELSIVAAPDEASSASDHVSLTVVSVEAQINGKWRTLSGGRQQIELPLGALPKPVSLVRAVLPAGALTNIRLGFGEHADHVELSAACRKDLPSCAEGAISFVIDHPRACLDRKKHGEARLRMLATDVTAGTCPAPAATIAIPTEGVGADPACAGVVCGPNQICRAGICVASDSCVNVVCAPGQVCNAGQCVLIVDMATSPDLATPPADLSTSPADMAKPADMCSANHGCTSGPSCKP